MNLKQERLFKRFIKNLEIEDLSLNDMITSELVGSSFYCTEDGTTFLSAICDYSCRSNDHVEVLNCSKIDRYSNKAYEKLQNNYNILRIVPESQYIMVTKRQYKNMSDNLKEYFYNKGYEIEIYI